jgi:hypothetical protein
VTDVTLVAPNTHSTVENIDHHKTVLAIPMALLLVAAAMANNEISAPAGLIQNNSTTAPRCAR